jgi:rubrerythrin
MGDLKADTKLAIELENKGYEFYQAAAGKAQNPLAKATLEGLAQREQFHIDKIMEYYRNLSGEKALKSDWLDLVKVAPTRGQLLKPILEKLKSNLQQKFENQSQIREAYHIAEGLERDSYTLYEKIAQENQADKLTSQFYGAIAKEEREHYAILEDSLLYLDQPGEWFRLQEKWIVEGG